MDKFKKELILQIIRNLNDSGYVSNIIKTAIRS
jgi:hypothetical protein